MLLVFGSIGADLVSGCDRFPRPGETVVGRTFAQYSGGKGANQALAAARAGAAVAMFGAVGQDAYAESATALLRAGGVGMAGVCTVPGSTGIAMIFVAADGQNCISVYAGANAAAQAAQVPTALLAPDRLVVLQHECPHAENMALAQRARQQGARVLLNAAPARSLTLAELAAVTFLVVNESEAEALAALHDWPATPREFARAAATTLANTVVVTLGAAGAVAATAEGCWAVAAPKVVVVDTTGAGDAFVGAFAARLDQGAGLAEAMRAGVAAGSLACTAAGAQAGLPLAASIAQLAQTLSVQRS